MDIKVKALTTADAPAVLNIHQKSFEVAWHTIDSLLHLPSTVGWLAINRDQSIGFILWQLVKGEADVLSFAVLPQYRNQGVGMLLYQTSEQAFLAQNITYLFLEVAQNNKEAITFYKNQGFVQTGIRKNYYYDNNQRVIHALTFAKTLKSA